MTPAPFQAQAPTRPPLVAHVIFQLGIGGLENGVVNLINNMPVDMFRHAVVCIKGATDFQRRLKRDDVPVITIGQQEGVDFASYHRAWRLFSDLRPDIVHTRNLAALEMQLPAALSGAGVRVHSEHGRDGRDLEGNYTRYNLVRKSFRPLVHRYVAMSQDLQGWLTHTIGIRSDRVEQIYNGVDTLRFAPRKGKRAPIGPEGFIGSASFVIGAVGRMAPIKDHATLVRAFAALCSRVPARAGELRLIIVGDGPCRRSCEQLAADLGVAARCWFAGDRDDVDRLLREFDVLCLTSLNEGINNTILEAMASGLPVIATAVGGNPELVRDGETGTLVPPHTPDALATGLLSYLEDVERRGEHGRRGRVRAEREFSIAHMVGRYVKLYDELLAARASMRRANAM